MIGRGLRIYPGKDLLLIIDFQWLTKRHQLLMDPTTLLLQDELPEVQTLAANRGSTEDPVADVRRARATYLHSLECTAYTREEAWLLAPPADVLSRTDAPPEWLRPTQKQVMAMRSFSILGWDRMTRVEAQVAIATAIARRQKGLAGYGQVQALVEHGLLSPERALACTDLRAKVLLGEWWRRSRKSSS
jgi:hypothetical protein